MTNKILIWVPKFIRKMATCMIWSISWSRCVLHHTRSECSPSYLNASGHISIKILKCGIITIFISITMFCGSDSILESIHGYFPHLVWITFMIAFQVKRFLSLSFPLRNTLGGSLKWNGIDFRMQVKRLIGLEMVLRRLILKSKGVKKNHKERAMTSIWIY